VSLYGDSLAYQSRAAFSTRMSRRTTSPLAVFTLPGTALCDYRGQIIDDLLRHRPPVVVLEFSGNSITRCMRRADGSYLAIGSSAWLERYLDDARAVLNVAAATDATVLWATAPPVRQPGSPADYPRQLAAAMRTLAASEPHLLVVDTGRALTTDNHAYRRALQCRSDEGTFCVGRRIDVRANDGLHFDCHGTPGELGGCNGYSAGGRRYGEAMADAAIAAPHRSVRAASSPNLPSRP
jgi:hypothetical protein